MACNILYEVLESRYWLFKFQLLDKFASFSKALDRSLGFKLRA